MEGLKAVNSIGDIPNEYRNTPIEELLLYHNLKKEFNEYANAQLLIGMCMDHRNQVRTPQNFAYVIRAGGTNLKHNDFHISFAVSVGNIKHMVIIGHTDCGMVNLLSKKELYLDGMVSNGGWDKDAALQYFNENAPKNAIGDSKEFTEYQTQHLREKYPLLTIAPMMYLVEDRLLYLIEE